MDEIRHIHKAQEDDEIITFTPFIPPVIDPKEEALDTILIEKKLSNENSNVK